MESSALVNPDDTDATVNEGPSADDTLDALVFLVNPDEHLTGLLEIQLVVPLGGHVLSGGIPFVGDAEELAADAVLLPVAHTANVKASEQFDEVFERHPEGAIFVVQHWLHNVDDLLSPEGRGVAPVAIPLELPPGVADVDELMAQSVNNTDHAIGVTWHETSFLVRAS